MPDDTFYNENEQALRPVGVDVRDSLPTLAIHILMARNPDFASMKSDSLVRELADIVTELQNSYQYVRP